MLWITIPDTPSQELWDEFNGEFITVDSKKGQTLQLEHSLVSLHKWESRWKTPFLTDKEKTIEQTIDYIKCMTITQNVHNDVYNRLSDDNIHQVDMYINDSKTATWFRNTPGGSGGKQLTAELLYYYMIELGIPFECRKWHLSQLITLIRVANEERKGSEGNKMSKEQIAQRNRKLNAERRKKYNSNG